MYIKEKSVLIYKIINVILTVVAFFLITASVYVFTSLAITYWDRPETLLYAKATPECIAYTAVGIVMLVIAGLSKRMIGDAYFYSSYFELDLDGYVTFEDLAKVTGKSEAAVEKQFAVIRPLLMKNFEIQAVQGVRQVVLNSKIALCECRSCGAHIEKRMYFTGICPYCDSSDLFAKVLTDNRFYSIDTRMSQGVNQPEFYQAKRLWVKMLLFVSLISTYAVIMLVSLIAVIDTAGKYNDKDYLMKILMTEPHMSSFDLIRADLRDMILGFLALLIVLAISTWMIWCAERSVVIAQRCSARLARSKVPFLSIKDMQRHLKMRGSSGKTVKRMRKSLQKGYLRNCTFEVHNKKLKIALAKCVTKDKCPTCLGPIVGAADQNYKCKYCGNMIMDVVQMKGANQ